MPTSGSENVQEMLRLSDSYCNRNRFNNFIETNLDIEKYFDHSIFIFCWFLKKGMF
jgi:hypothetical protein